MCSRMDKTSHRDFFLLKRIQTFFARNSNKVKVHSSRKGKTERFKLTFLLLQRSRKKREGACVKLSGCDIKFLPKIRARNKKAERYALQGKKHNHPANKNSSSSSPPIINRPRARNNNEFLPFFPTRTFKEARWETKVGGGVRIMYLGVVAPGQFRN